jgi:predicted nucleic acid-binding Zn ribbon protein
MLARPVPAEPDPDEVVAVEQDYRCTVCGMRLTVTHAQEDAEADAPRHCREPMVEA